MMRIENDCVGCKDVGLPCMGSNCPHRSVLHCYCDKCNEECEELYRLDDDELCEDCLKESCLIEV